MQHSEVISSMFDPLRNRYSLRCPETDEPEWVAVSAFRTVRRLRGARRPAVFRVEFDCPCGGRHEALVSHDRLDYEPLGTSSAETFTDLVSGGRSLLGAELAEVAGEQIRHGNWPWAFWCHPESALRPGFPSSLRFVTPEHDRGDDRLGVLVRCFSCERHTVNFVSHEHLDVPFHADRIIGFVDQVFEGDRVSDAERFRHQIQYGHERAEWLEAG